MEQIAHMQIFDAVVVPAKLWPTLGLGGIDSW